MLELLEARIAPAALSFLKQLANTPEANDLVAVDGAGNIFVAGVFKTSFSLPTGPLTSLSVTTTDPAGDVYYAKFNSRGTPLWLKKWGGVGPEFPGAMTVNTAGDVFLTGSFDSPGAGFGGSGALSSTAGVPQLFAFKALGTTGDAATWGTGGQIKFGGAATTAAGTALAVANNGDLLIGGHFEGSSVAFNGGTLPITTRDGLEGMVIRLVASGAQSTAWGSFGVVLTNAAGSPNPTADSVFRIDLDSVGNVFVGTRTRSTSVGIAPVPIATDQIAKLNSVTGATDSLFNSGVPLFVLSAPVKQNPISDFTIDSQDRLYVVYSTGKTTAVERHRGDGTLDTTYGNLLPTTSGSVIKVPAKNLTALIDSRDRLLIGGTAGGLNFLARLTTDGQLDRKFFTTGLATFGAPKAITGNGYSGMAIDSNDMLLFRDSFVGVVDLNPTSGATKLKTRSLAKGNQEGFLLRVDTVAVDRNATTVFEIGTGPNGKPSNVEITLTGPGGVRIIEDDSAILGIELSGTTLDSHVIIRGVNLSTMFPIERIYTTGEKDDLGSLVMTPNLGLGTGFSGSDPNLLVTGRMNSIAIGSVLDFAVIKLGQGLPYNDPDPRVSDTYNNRPHLTMGNVLGPGVVVEVLGDGTPGGVGGGGLGNVMIGSWAFPGVIRTTQSVGDFTIREGDFYAVLEIDKFRNGEETVADVGAMDVQNGDWGSSGSEIEGNVESFNAEEFLAGASITAGSVGKVSTDEGDFAGTLTLTDEDAKGVATFNVDADFTGTVVSSAPLKKLNIKADFRGSLTAPSIASITAFAFLGNEANPNLLKIVATDGLLGKITAKAGVVKNFEFMAMNASFSGLNVTQKKITDPTAIGIENVKISALTIGPISVNLSADKSSAVNLTGIQSSSFEATAPDGKASIGAIKVKLAGASGSSTGLNIASFLGDTIGNVSVNVARGSSAGSTARAINDLTLHASLSLGKVSVSGDATEAQATGLRLWSGGKIGTVSVASKTSEFATLQSSQILAGQALAFTAGLSTRDINARLTAASLGGLKVGGSLRGVMVAAGANIGAIAAGLDIADSLFLAGARLGADEAFGGAGDTFQRAARIASVTVKGALSGTTISAGINPSGVGFGDGNDVLAIDESGQALSSEIGPIAIGTGQFGAIAPVLPHTFAIQAAKLAKITFKGLPPLKDFVAGTPVLLDTNASATEDPTDAIARILA